MRENPFNGFPTSVDVDGQFFPINPSFRVGISIELEILKEKNPDIKIIAMEPAASPMLSEGTAGPHKIQGIGAGFVPEILDTDIYDKVVTVENDAAFEYGKELAKTEGFLVGISSGAALYAAMEEAKKPENEGKTIVVLLPDNGDRYYSCLLYTSPSPRD